MGKRKGELSRAAIDRGWPHQVALKARFVAGANHAIIEREKTDLKACPRCHSVQNADEWFVVYCFGRFEDAETFRQKFGGETFYPEDHGKGSDWSRWNKKERRPKVMLDTAKKRKELIEHLEAALILADEVSQPVTAYLIDRALDDARGQDWGLKQHERS